ncbi:hypothetical protein CIB84_012469, partial [Bambusicola thoracicus]
EEFGKERICPYCFQFLVPDSYRVRLKPKMKVTPQIEKIIKREAKNYRLNMKQIKLLKKYRDSKSVLATTSSISRTPRNSKFHFTKLKRMLNLEEKEKSQKVDLKTFLTLL